MKNNPKVWILIWGCVCLILLVPVALLTAKLDPFFHYHSPDTKNWYYVLNNERSQNDGIMKRFEYDSVITGTSMTENFKTSEAEELFGGHFIKAPFSGASFNEINDNLKTALKYNSKIKTVIRGLDLNKLLEDKDIIREDLGVYPTYLYDDNIWNDTKYLFNRDVFFGRVIWMIQKKESGDFEPGISSFDNYAYWNNRYKFGVKSIYPEGISFPEYAEPKAMTEEEKEMLLENLKQNVTTLADEYPNVTFYLFLTPYSAAWWKELLENGEFEKEIEIEKITIEELLKHPNIKLFSFNDRVDLTTDLNNYKDERHYGAWINSYMLKAMSEGKHQLTEENYKEYLEYEKVFYFSYDYTQLENQKDYKKDWHAAERLQED